MMAYGHLDLSEDSQEAFLSSTIQKNVDGTLVFEEERPLTCISIPRVSDMLIATSAFTVAGLRFSTMNIFHVKRLETSVGSRSFHQICLPTNALAAGIMESERKALS